MTAEGFRERAIRRARAMRAARSSGRKLWVGLGLVGSVGWMIALPMVGGAFLGRYLDEALDTRLSFTLGLMLLGLAIGAYSVWRLFLRTPP